MLDLSKNLRALAFAAVAVLSTAFISQATEAPLTDKVFEDLENKNPELQDMALQRLYAAENDALSKNQPVPVRIRKALVHLLQLEATHTYLESEQQSSQHKYVNEEHLPQLIQSVTALHDRDTIDLLLNPWILGTAMVESEVASYGDSIFPKLLAHYASPTQNPKESDSTRTVRFYIMAIMVEMMKIGAVNNKDYINKIESIFIANARSSEAHGTLRAIATRGLKYFADPEARALARSALKDPNPGIRLEAESTIKAQEELLGGR